MDTQSFDMGARGGWRTDCAGMGSGNALPPASAKRRIEMVDLQFRFCLRALGFVGSVALAGCGAAGGEGEGIATEHEPLVITTCTGAAISAAVAAGGVVTLNCGSSPITIQVPFTTVAHSTQLSSAQPGTVTFTHLSTLFEVTSGATLSINGISFDGTGHGSTAIHADEISTVQNVVRSNAVVSNYSGGLTFMIGGGSSLNVSNTTFQNNTGAGFASPIYGEGGHLTISNSTFFNNRNTSGQGGAITALGSSLNVNGCTFMSNVAAIGGAIYSTLAPVITNSTFAFNTGTLQGGALSLLGGAQISNSTFVTNPSPTGTIRGTAQVSGSIIYDPTASSAPCSLTGSSNIQWPAVTPLCGPGFRFADPKLGALANNGGPTNTFALLPGSAAIDSLTGVCPSTDQRGVLRPRDGDGNGSFVCDVGAYER